MLFLSAVLSLGLMWLTFSMYRSRREATPILKALLPATGGVVVGYSMVLPTLFLHAAVVISAVFLWKWRRWPPNAFLAYMVLAALGLYGFFSYLAVEQIAEQQRLRKEYAFESMEERLPEPKSQVVAKLSKETEQHLSQLEKGIRGDSNSFRALMLQRLHQDSVRDFIAGPGFGVGRRIQPTERTLKVNLDHRGAAIPQPDPASSIYSEDILREPIDVQPGPLRELHLDSIVDFTNPRGFGLVVSRQEVAGFQSHQFSMVPEAKQWKVQTVELVGLLLHDDPVVYVSDELPQMEKLRHVPTRSLNGFETAGFKRLQEGDDLFIRETTETIRMLGAVRSINQCVKCHGGTRGDLLGAFSYRLQRVP